MELGQDFFGHARHMDDSDWRAAREISNDDDPQGRQEAVVRLLHASCVEALGSLAQGWAPRKGVALTRGPSSVAAAVGRMVIDERWEDCLRVGAIVPDAVRRREPEWASLVGCSGRLQA